MLVLQNQLNSTLWRVVSIIRSCSLFLEPITLEDRNLYKESLTHYVCSYSNTLLCSSASNYVTTAQTKLTKAIPPPAYYSTAIH